MKNGNPAPQAIRNARVLGRLGSLEIRLVRSTAEIRAAQALRYQVFNPEMAVKAARTGRVLHRDADAWDQVSNHLVVLDHGGPAPCMVATCRFFDSHASRRSGIGFYTSQEFDVAPLMARHDGLKFMELGRSCVLPEWRNKRTMELLWHGIWSHVLAQNVDVLTGCASFSGTDPFSIAEPLSFLHYHAALQPEWQVRAIAAETLETNLLPAASVDPKRAMRALPPLVKGYLRLGAGFGRQAVIDREFGSIDVLVVLPVKAISPRYVSHYGADAGRYAVDS